MISCSRDNDNTNPTTPQTPATSEIGILPVKFTSSNGKIATMTYNGNKLAKIIDDGIIWSSNFLKKWICRNSSSYQAILMLSLAGSFPS